MFLANSNLLFSNHILFGVSIIIEDNLLIGTCAGPIDSNLLRMTGFTRLVQMHLWQLLLRFVAPFMYFLHDQQTLIIIVAIIITAITVVLVSCSFLFFQGLNRRSLPLSISKLSNLLFQPLRLDLLLEFQQFIIDVLLLPFILPVTQFLQEAHRRHGCQSQAQRVLFQRQVSHRREYVLAGHQMNRTQIRFERLFRKQIHVRRRGHDCRRLLGHQHRLVGVQTGRFDLNLRLRQRLHHPPLLLRQHQQQRLPPRRIPRRPSHAMDVHLHVLRRIGLDDPVDVRKVQPPRGHVGRE
mmetsp:Transcript_39724/g.95557  ORF Transcript_39724/g.95557 Transcript_39724/m.95557 type:complete len:295 (+) Transcript_39724:475-1359(+)